MDADEVAKALAKLGKSDFKHIAALERNRVERCELLCALVESGQAGLSPTVAPLVVEPKDKP